MSSSTPVRSRLETCLDRLSWAYQTANLEALDFRFTVRVMDAALGAYLDRILAQLAGGEPAEHVYSLVDRGFGSRSRRFRLFLDGERLVSCASPVIALSYLLWHVNRAVVQNSSPCLLIHAAAVEDAGSGLVFPAPTESGKTTLAAGLVARGMRYLTDEAVAIDPATLMLVPYAKPLFVGSGSWAVLPELAPGAFDGAEQYIADQWYVAPASIRPDAVAPRCYARLVILPRYMAAEPTRLSSIGRAEAVAVLAENSFNLSELGRGGLEILAQVVSGCECYRLVWSDLGDACRAVRELSTKATGGLRDLRRRDLT